MDDPTSSIPFEFEDCDAFLASLDDNNTSAPSSKFHQDFSDMNDFTGATTDSWSIPLPSTADASSSAAPISNNPNNNNSSNYMISAEDLDSAFRSQENFYDGAHDSSHSSPLSSPSMSINSISDSDTTGGFLSGSLLYSGANNASLDNTQFSAANLDNYDSLTYPITPPYPSASTNSSNGELGTSPEDYGLNDGYNYPSFTSLNSNFAPIKEEHTSPKAEREIKNEPISPNDTTPPADSCMKKASQKSQPKKPVGQKLNNDSKSSKVTKPKKEKTSHNMIEKRYRTNINDKILALRDCVPSLRCVVSGGRSASEDLEGLTPASKLNKATVLTKATEYILHLQKRNNMLLKELQDARARSSVDMSVLPEISSRQNTMSAYPQREPNNYASKAMMLSMAGLMGAGMMNDGNDLRGLSALPVFSFLSSSPFNPESVVFALKVALIAGTVLYLVAPSLFDSSAPKDEKSEAAEYVDDTQEHSLKDIRRQSWLTSTRSFTVPAENLSAQTIAFFKNIVSILVINLMGTEGYEMVARVFDKEQLAHKRIAVSRAIDAQLCGGDHNVTRGRLFYTFVKSFILPPTASRYLTQAVHINILCNGIRFVDVAASYVAKYFWMRAKNAAASERPTSEEDATPKHIRELLQSYADNTTICKRLTNVAYGLPVSEGCSTGDEDEGYFSVVTDKSIRSIGDVIAALYCNSLVHKVLVNVLESDEIDFRMLEHCEAIAPPCSIVSRRVAITEALLLGPKDASYAKNAMDMLKEELVQQAWISRNVDQVASMDSEESDVSLSSTDESESESIRTERPISNDISFLSSAKTNTTPFVVSQDSRLGIRCSLILCYLSRNMNAHAFSLLQNVEINKLENIGLLGFVAMWKVLREMHERKYTAASANRHKLEDLSAVARVWLGGNAATQEGIELSKLRDLVGESVEMSKWFGGFGLDRELDEGYGTQ